MRKTTLILAVLTGVGGIGGTGHAAPLAPTAADDGAVVLYAYAVDRGGLAAPLGGCEAMATADRATCRGLETALAESRRKASLAALSKDWSGARLGAFARLVTTADAFARAVGMNETDRADDGRAAEAAEKVAFWRTLQALVAGHAQAAAGLSTAALDGALNAAYTRVMAVRDMRDLAWGSVDKAGIRRTERAWLAYRDAFVAFAATLEAPDAAATIKAELTRRRTASLEGFLED